MAPFSTNGNFLLLVPKYHFSQLPAFWPRARYVLLVLSWNNAFLGLLIHFIHYCWSERLGEESSSGRTSALAQEPSGLEEFPWS